MKTTIVMTVETTYTREVDLTQKQVDQLLASDRKGILGDMCLDFCENNNAHKDTHVLDVDVEIETENGETIELGDSA